MSCKAALYTANTTNQTITPTTNGSVIPVGSIVRRFGNNTRCNRPFVNTDGTNVNIVGQGYYSVNCSLTVTPTVAGPIMVRLFKDGTPIPGAVAATQTTAATQTVNLGFPALVREQCCDSASNLSVVVTGGTFVLNNMCVLVEKL